MTAFPLPRSAGPGIAFASGTSIGSRGTARLRFWLLALVFGAATSSHAASFSVANTSDSGPGSLRDAVAQANAAPGADTIDFSVTGTITLISGEIPVNGPLTIVGPGAGALTIDGNASSRIFSIFASDPACPAQDGPDYLVSISGVRLTNAQRQADGGGAIFSAHSLALASVVIDNSAASDGGAVFLSMRYPGQALTITDSQFNNNVAKAFVPTVAGLSNEGGAIHVVENCAGTTTTTGTITIERSVFSGNRAQPADGDGGDGGAISIRFGGDLTLTDSRIVDNHVDLPSPAPSDYFGGGLFALAKSLRIERSEIAGNSADWGGGAYLLNDVPELQVPGGPAQVQVINSTVAANRAISGSGGALLVYGNVAVEIDNSTISDNVAQVAGLTGGIQLSTGPTLPVSTANAVAPSLKLVSSIVSNSSGADIGSFTAVIPAVTIDADHSLIETWCQTCNISLPGTTNLLGIDPMFDPLAFNGGPTRSYALYPGSLAINAGSNPLGLTTDQRGAPYWRIGAGGTDIGALESDAVTAVTVVEFYNAGLDHYFITWVADEIAKLDDGTFKGWARTGLSFKAYPVLQPDTSAVCRIYIPPGQGDGHFFGRDSKECDSTMAKNPTFDLESAGFFFLYPPNLGLCVIGTAPVYRVFSNRADANHRYTTNRAVRDQMVAKGWLAEGDGPNLVVMCAPQ